jgi:hypothetical protein
LDMTDYQLLERLQRSEGALPGISAHAS